MLYTCALWTLVFHNNVVIIMQSFIYFEVVRRVTTYVYNI